MINLRMLSYFVSVHEHRVVTFAVYNVLFGSPFKLMNKEHLKCILECQNILNV